MHIGFPEHNAKSEITIEHTPNSTGVKLTVNITFDLTPDEAAGLLAQLQQERTQLPDGTTVEPNGDYVPAPITILRVAGLQAGTKAEQATLITLESYINGIK